MFLTPAGWEAEAGGQHLGAKMKQLSDAVRLWLKIKITKKCWDAAPCEGPGFSPQYHKQMNKKNQGANQTQCDGGHGGY